MVRQKGQPFGKAGVHPRCGAAAALVWTDALGPLFRPNAEAFMTAEITMEPTSDGTRYRALVRHKNAQDQAKHKEMGFFQGWDCRLELEELATQLRA